MNLGEWLQRLELLHPKEIELGLERVAKVAQQLPVTKIAHRVITVAGTNGKGTTVRLLANILSNAGLKVGCYSSPHLHHYNERVLIEGLPVEDQALCDAFVRVDKARRDIPLTYFEFGTLAAFDLFARANLDIVLLEVGLGGRLDATNILNPDIAVVTSVALDHQEWLGNSRESIGYEKAGIMRPGLPAICGDPNPPLSLLQYAESLAVNLDCSGREFGYELTRSEDGKVTSWNWWGQNNKEQIKFFGLPLPEIPIENAATAIQTLMRLQLPIDEVHLRQGILRTRLPGRYQRIDKPVPIILDVAHNPHAASYLAERLKRESVKGCVHALVGILADKDYDTMVQVMIPIIDYWSVSDLPTPRALSGEKLASVIQQQGAAVESYSSVSSALGHLCETLTQEDLLVIFGSFYTVSEALTHLESRG